MRRQRTSASAGPIDGPRANLAADDETDGDSLVPATTNQQLPVVRQLLDAVHRRTPPRRLHSDRVRRPTRPIGQEGDHHD